MKIRFTCGQLKWTGFFEEGDECGAETEDEIDVETLEEFKKEYDYWIIECKSCGHELDTRYDAWEIVK